MTAKQLEILQHSLGLDQYGQGEMYRNHFCAGGADENICRELIALGYMQQHPTTKWLPYFNCSVTEEGKKAVLRESPKPPKLSRSQKRYRDFLKADPAMTFGEWIKATSARERESGDGGIFGTGDPYEMEHNQHGSGCR